MSNKNSWASWSLALYCTVELGCFIDRGLDSGPNVAKSSFQNGVTLRGFLCTSMCATSKDIVLSLHLYHAPEEPKVQLLTRQQDIMMQALYEVVARGAPT